MKPGNYDNVSHARVDTALGTMSRRFSTSFALGAMLLGCLADLVAIPRWISQQDNRLYILYFAVRRHRAAVRD